MIAEQRNAFVLNLSGSLDDLKMMFGTVLSVAVTAAGAEADRLQSENKSADAVEMEKQAAELVSLRDSLNASAAELLTVRRELYNSNRDLERLRELYTRRVLELQGEIEATRKRGIELILTDSTDAPSPIDAPEIPVEDMADRRVPRQEQQEPAPAEEPAPEQREEPEAQEQPAKVEKVAGGKAAADQVLAFIRDSSPTVEELATRFDLSSKQSIWNMVFRARGKLANDMEIVLADGRYVERRREEPAPVAPAAPEPIVAEPAKPEPVTPKAAPVIVPIKAAPKPAAAPAAPAIPSPPATPVLVGTLLTVSPTLMTATGRNGQAMKVSSSFAIKLFEKMAGGEMFGLEQLRKHAGYATVDAVRLALSTHKAALTRLGLIVYTDKINARLAVAP